MIRTQKPILKNLVRLMLQNLKRERGNGEKVQAAKYLLAFSLGSLFLGEEGASAFSEVEFLFRFFDLLTTAYTAVVGSVIVMGWYEGWFLPTSLCTSATT
jgi:hypothetical protein